MEWKQGNGNDAIAKALAEDELFILGRKGSLAITGRIGAEIGRRPVETFSSANLLFSLRRQ